MKKCTACGKGFDSGATIIGANVYCLECGKELDNIVAEITVNIELARMSGEKIDADKLIEKYEAQINKFELSKAQVLRMALPTRREEKRPR